MRKWNLDLRMFEGDGGAAAAANGEGQNAGGSAAGASSQQTADQAVQVLEDGTRVDPRLAERMEKQRKRHNRGNAGAAASAMTGGEQAQQQAQAQPQQNEKTPDEEFDALIHGNMRSSISSASRTRSANDSRIRRTCRDSWTD